MKTFFEIFRVVLFFVGCGLMFYILYQARCLDLKEYDLVTMNMDQLGIAESFAIAFIFQFFMRS